MEPNGVQMEPNGAQMELKWSSKELAQMELKWNSNGAQMQVEWSRGLVLNDPGRLVGGGWFLTPEVLERCQRGRPSICIISNMYIYIYI